jgi:predicted lipoprotein with Yx(FWY)xxD motif
MATDTQTPSQPRRARGRGPARSMTALGAVAVVGLIAAACGSSTPAATSATTTTTSPASTPAGTTGSSGQVVAEIVSNAKIGSPILVNSSSMTLYKFSADSGDTSACNAGCAAVWPPLTVPAGTTPKGGPGTGGTFGTISRTGGTLQVTYDGHPLYTFTGDSSAGATSGENLVSDGGKWTVVTIGATGTSSNTNSPPTTKTPSTTKASSGGYGY